MSIIGHWPSAAIVITAIVCFTLLVLGFIGALPWQGGEPDDYGEGDWDDDHTAELPGPAARHWGREGS